ncbi:MAG: hypothetical protein WCL17_02580 [Actinomycetota bacterium]
MKKILKPKVVIYAVTLALLSASGLFFLSHSSSNNRSSFSLPSGIVPGPAGIVSGALVGDGQRAWVLTNTGTASNAQLISVATGKVLEIIPTSVDSTSIAIENKDMIAVGAGTATSGFVSLFSTVTKTQVGVVPTAGPVSTLKKAPNSNKFYAMISTPTSKAIQVVNPSLLHVESKSLPLPMDANTFYPSKDGQSLIVLKSNGTVTYISTSTGDLTQTFKVGPNPIDATMNASGTRLYVLKGIGDENVAVVDTTTDAVLKALPAPKNAHSFAITPNGVYLVTFVGTDLMGNIQTFSTN